MDIQGDVRVAHDRGGNAVRIVGFDAAALEGGGELARLRFRMTFQLATLDVELVLEQLLLRRHGDELASGHREGAGDEAGEPGEPDDAGGGAGTGHPEDERDVGEQAVADAEHGRPRSASLDVAMVRVHAVVSGQALRHVGSQVHPGQRCHTRERRRIHFAGARSALGMRGGS